MKKQLIGAAAALLLLAGCGSANEATKKETKACTFKESGQEIVITLEADDNIIKTMTVGIGMDVGVDLNEEQLAAMKPAILESIGYDEEDGVEVKLESKDGVLHAEVKMDASADGAFMKSMGIDADESDLCVAVGLDLIRLVAGQPLAVLGRVGQVAAQVLIFGLVDELLQLGQRVVKFMVAEGSEVIAELVHDIDQIFALGQRADDVALHGVAAVDERDVVVRRLHLLLIRGKTGVADVVIDGAVHVVGVQDHNVVGFLICCEYRGHQTQDHAYCQQKRDQFLHSILP